MTKRYMQPDLSCKIVERHGTYRYLGLELHATRSMSYGAGVLVSAARKAVHAMRRRCAHLHTQSCSSVQAL